MLSRQVPHLTSVLVEVITVCVVARGNGKVHCKGVVVASSMSGRALPFWASSSLVDMPAVHACLCQYVCVGRGGREEDQGSDVQYKAALDFGNIKQHGEEKVQLHPTLHLGSHTDMHHYTNHTLPTGPPSTRYYTDRGSAVSEVH